MHVNWRYDFCMLRATFNEIVFFLVYCNVHMLFALLLIWNEE